MEQYCFQQFFRCVKTGLQRLKASQAAEKLSAAATRSFRLGLFFSVLHGACLKVGAHHRIKLHNLQQSGQRSLGSSTALLVYLKKSEQGDK